MNLKLPIRNIIVFLLFSCTVLAQDVALFQQFNGRYDFTIVGNTLNTSENNLNTLCSISTSSSAILTMDTTDEIEKAYLYWAGSGTGDLNVLLNGTPITSERNFAFFQNDLDYFCAFTDVTAQIRTTGNGNYTLSDLDVSPFLNPTHYCNNRTNFAGWAIVIIYKNESLPLNQINVYDGLQGVSRTQNDLTLTLNSLNVIDNVGSKIGFIAWEGDVNLPNPGFTESLKINGNTLSNALNPPNNAFNGTNTFTGSSTLYNMDLDVYEIQDFIDIRDESVEIQLTSQQDFVMISTVLTKLNNQLPDATISIDNVALECNSRRIIVDYTVYNIDSTDPLIAEVPISIYANGILIEQTLTVPPIPIGGSYSDSIHLTIPDEIPNDFTLKFVVDDGGNGTGIVTELNEMNNDFSVTVSFLVSPEFNPLETIFACNEGLKKGTFNFSHYEDAVKIDPSHVVHFFASQEEAESNENPILNSHNYIASVTPKEIFVRIEDENCYSITSFLLDTKNCPPTVYNAVTANDDGWNDFFFIDGLRDIFLNFELLIYNRWGTLVWTGNNNTENWYGKATKGIEINGTNLPDGTYYYVLDLNDPDYKTPLTGYVYLTR
ncbi:gliding motility-associated-like protein [Flavobacterium gossypii]|uniref:Gliding motility-associated-like protein n=1 Tax=Flavobacterium gossypii TaxID=1646119 RepID=A0ABR6DUA8_9FLAO|nr:gliding motility-associated C-terminal domain-containing protein [Flavobacterium gossypii]MBA9075270.1 gliding motility-associated-like protein [Flavobacterium gossypii]